jgi:hypothetical protein
MRRKRIATLAGHEMVKAPVRIVISRNMRREKIATIVGHEMLRLPVRNLISRNKTHKLRGP